MGESNYFPDDACIQSLKNKLEGKLGGKDDK
jgi:hypothetical protein